MKVERSPRRLLNALAERMTALPPDSCAFGDWFGIVFGEAGSTSLLDSKSLRFSAW